MAEYRDLVSKDVPRSDQVMNYCSFIVGRSVACKFHDIAKHSKVVDDNVCCLEMS